MRDHQLRGHIGGITVGTNTYVITMEFHVYASDDDAALERVTRVLPKGDFDMAWAWTGTQLTNKGEASE